VEFSSGTSSARCYGRAADRGLISRQQLRNARRGGPAHKILEMLWRAASSCRWLVHVRLQEHSELPNRTSRTLCI